MDLSEHYLSNRILKWFQNWEGITYGHRQAKIFAEDIENIHASDFSSITIRGTANERVQIQKLLVLMAPIPLRVVSIEDPALQGDKRIKNVYGSPVNLHFTIWVAFRHPRNHITAVLFCYRMPYANALSIHAKKITSASDNLILQESINRGFMHDDIYNLLVFKANILRLISDPSMHFTNWTFNVIQNELGNWVSTVDDATLWTAILPLIAESVGVQLVHIAHPTRQDLMLLQSNPLYLTGNKTPERPIALFCTADSLRLFAVTPNVQNMDEEYLPFAAGRRIFLRVDAP